MLDLFECSFDYSEILKDYYERSDSLKPFCEVAFLCWLSTLKCVSEFAASEAY